jgi:hypothetical protein
MRDIIAAPAYPAQTQADLKIADDGEMIERVENILRAPKRISYPSSAAAEYVREQLQELLMAYLRLRQQNGDAK